jgi:hypothetical protein
MATIPCISVPSPQDIKGGLFPKGVVNPISLPQAWAAQIMLTPFGGKNAAKITPSDQLVVGNLTYEALSATERCMRVSLYLLESLQYYDFFFRTSGATTQWWALVSDPGNPDGLPTKAFGPFATTAIVPPQDFLTTSGFSHAGTWEILGRSCDSFSGRANAKSGTWYSFDGKTADLSRIMNVDNSNDFKIAILGAYYFADFAKLQRPSASNLKEVYAKCGSAAAAAAPSAMLTMSDILKVMAAPPSGSQVPCTLSQIQSLIPGISVADESVTIPAWTNQVTSFCYMIGQDTYPYYCQLWYDWVRGKQITVFVQQDQNGAYTQRFDEVLPKGVVGPAVVYSWDGAKWMPACCQAGGSVVPMSVPNFVEAAAGTCRAIIKNNPYFGSISVWTVDLGGASDFWYWFGERQQGVVFSLAPAGSLTIIYYQTFVQNGGIDACVFDDPCPDVPACPSNLTAMVRAKPGFRPLTHSSEP